MKLVYYEIKKLCGIRYLWVMLLIMAVACAGMFYYRTDAVSFDRTYEENMRELAREYARDPSRVEAAQAASEEYNAAVSAVFDELSGGSWIGIDEDDDEFWDAYYLAIDAIEYDDYTLGFYYANGDPMSDQTMIRNLPIYIYSTEDYRAEVSRLMKVAEGTMRLYEVRHAADTPAYEYQKHFYERFAAARDSVELEPVMAYGWQEYFGFDELGAFVFVYLTLAAGVVFFHERRCGTLQILRTSKRGRVRTTAAKLAALFVVNVFAVFVFTAAVFVTCGLVFGFSTASEPIQAVLGSYCPYLFSVGGYAVIQFLIRCFAAFLFSCTVALAASLTFSPIAAYATGAFVIISNMVVNYFVSSSDWLSLNLISMTTTRVFGKYSELYVFGHYYPTASVALVIYAVAAVAASVVIIVVGGRRNAVPTPGGAFSLRRAWAKIRERIKLPTINRQKRYPRALFAYECGKLLTPKVVIVVVLLLAAAALEAQSAYGEVIFSAVRERDEYVREHFFGELTEEMYEEFIEHKDAVEEASSDERRDGLIRSYMSGEMTHDELFELLDEYDLYKIEYRLIEDVASDVDRLVLTEDETGVRGWLIPETMISRVLGRDVNIFLLAALLIVFSRAYDADYAGKSSEGNFAAIMRTTRRGRREVYRAKMFAALAAALGITVAFEAVDLVFGIAMTDDFATLLSAPIVSIESYSMIGSGITIGWYLAGVLLLRVLSFVMLAILTCVASYVVRQMQPALFITAMWTLLPYALIYMGVRSLQYVDFTAMLAGGKLLERSAEFSVAGWPYTFAVLLVFGYGALTAAATLYVRRRTGE